MVTHFSAPSVPGRWSRDEWADLLRPRALCGERTSLFSISYIATEVTCTLGLCDLLSPDQGDLGSACQASPIPPQRSALEPP